MDLFFFRFYLIFVLIFLIIFAFVISKQLFFFISNNIKLNSLYIQLKKNNIESLNCLDLATYYASNKQFFLSVCCSEFLLESRGTLIREESVANFLAYIYNEKLFYSIAEYYLLDMLSLSNFNKNALLNLIHFYNSIGFVEKSDFIIKNMQAIDS